MEGGRLCFSELNLPCCQDLNSALVLDYYVEALHLPGRLLVQVWRPRPYYLQHGQLFSLALRWFRASIKNGRRIVP